MPLVSTLQDATDQLMESAHISAHFLGFFCLTWADIFQPLCSNQNEVSDFQFEQFSESLHRPFAPTQGEKSDDKRFLVSH